VEPIDDSGTRRTVVGAATSGPVAWKLDLRGVESAPSRELQVVANHVQELTFQAVDLLLAVVDHQTQIPADLAQDIRELEKGCHGRGWVRWLQYASVAQHESRIVNYCQVASTALLALRDHCRVSGSTGSDPAPAEKVAAATDLTPVVSTITPAAKVTSGSREIAGSEAAEQTDGGSELTDRQTLIIETMMAEEITSHRRRKSRRAIVRLINRTHRESTYGRDFSALVKLGYLQSSEGPTGGMWLTPEGKAAAKSHRNDSESST
jgi:hypothetical protein